jgi:hypothetical protein
VQRVPRPTDAPARSPGAGADAASGGAAALIRSLSGADLAHLAERLYPRIASSLRQELRHDRARAGSATDLDV